MMKYSFFLLAFLLFNETGWARIKKTKCGKTINLSKNEVRSLNDLGNSLECLKSVRSIDISYNQLTTVDNDLITDSWPRLEDLRLNHNNQSSAGKSPEIQVKIEVL
jgi:Leucine-rich repeat (LRR) protein